MTTQPHGAAGEIGASTDMGGSHGELLLSDAIIHAVRFLQRDTLIMNAITQ
jgi:hypothetical protein